MREDCAVPQVALVEPGGAAGGVSSERYVHRGLKALVAGTVDLTTKTSGLIVVEPCCASLKVQDQPQFEARVGHSEIDAVLAGLLDGLVKPGMVLRPLDIEYAPELINL